MAKKSKVEVITDLANYEAPLPAAPSEEKLNAIGSYILDGLTLDESCCLVGYPYHDFLTLEEKDPLFKEWLKKKLIEFKHKHLQVISSKQNEKNSVWMLENMLPEEFGRTRATSPGGESVNIVAMILKGIQGEYNLPVNLKNDNEQPVVIKPRIIEHESQFGSIDQILK